jgi:hypothetical protein
MSSNIINLYIPRILGNIKQNKIISLFKNMSIGDIFYIDMYKKMNENNNLYSFAFISIKLYDNKIAKDLEKTLNTTGVTRITYDYEKNHYWEVKKHIDRSKRGVRIPSPTSVSTVDYFGNDYENDCDNKSNRKIQKSQLLDTVFTKKDKDDLEKEYEELEKEITLFLDFNIHCQDNNVILF